MKTFCIRIFLSLALTGAITCNAQTLVARWTFPTGTAADSLADGGLPVNLTEAIRTDGGTSAIDFSKNGLTTKAAQATGWDNGAMSKSWIIQIATVNYDHLKISSKQQSGGNNPGPQDYIVQYRIALNGTWTDVPGAVIVTANNWTSGVVDSVALPDTCSNQPSLFLRWLMTTNTNTTGGAVTSAGIDKIDDIYITGKQLSTGLTEEQAAVVCRIYPNPAREKLFIESYVAISEIALINPQGTAGLIMPGRGGDSLEVNLSTLLPGIYFVKVQLQSGKSIIRKILLY